MRSRNCVLAALLTLLQFSPAVVASEELKPSTEAAAQTQQLRFEIEGMSCESCVNSITEALRATPGVENAVVSLEPQQAEVTLKPTGAPSAEALIKVITDLGYTAKLASK